MADDQIISPETAHEFHASLKRAPLVEFIWQISPYGRYRSSDEFMFRPTSERIERVGLHRNKYTEKELTKTINPASLEYDRVFNMFGISSGSPVVIWTDHARTSISKDYVAGIWDEAGGLWYQNEKFSQTKKIGECTSGIQVHFNENVGYVKSGDGWEQFLVRNEELDCYYPMTIHEKSIENLTI